MNREQLLEFAAHVEACEEDDQWHVAMSMINCARQDWAITEGDKTTLLLMLDEARRSGLSTVPLAIALELGRKIVPDLMGRGITITGPSDQFPTDCPRRWSVKLDGIRLGLAPTLTLALAAAICRVIATKQDRAMAAEFLRQRQQVATDLTALRVRLGQPRGGGG